MKRGMLIQSVVLFIVCGVVGVASAGFIDTDGYYMFDLGEIKGLVDGASGAGVTLNLTDDIISTTNWPSTGNQYWTQIGAADMSYLPDNYGDAVGVKIKLSNQSGDYDFSFQIILQTTSNSWTSDGGVWLPTDGTPVVESTDIPVVGEQVYYIFVIITSNSTVGERAAKVVDAPEDTTIPHNPSPATGISERLDDLEPVLSWNTALDPETDRPYLNIRKHYLLGSFNNAGDNDPNLYYIDEVNAPTVSGTDPNIVATAQYAGLAPLKYDRIYYWQIIEGLEDPNDPGVVRPYTDPNNIAGPVWRFLTRPSYAAPELDFPSVITTLDLADPGPINISADVQTYDEITSATVTLLSDDLNFPASATYTFLDTTSDPKNPTATLSTDTVGTYYVEIEATDNHPTEPATITGIAEVVVIADACEAAKDSRSSEWAQNHYDRDGDCDVDLPDFAEFALEWLAESFMKAQESFTTGDLGYIPQAVYDARIEAESVDPNAVSEAPLGDPGIRIVDDKALGWTDTDAYAEYDIDLDAAVYDVYVSYATPNAGNGLQFGDGTTVDLYGSIETPSTGSWSGYVVNGYVGALDCTSVTPGIQTVRITWTGNGPNLDWFTLVEQP